MLAKFSGFNPKGLHMSFKKEKETFCVCVHLLRKASTLIRKFHIAVVQRRLRNVQKKA